jgi:hypothetical protein
LRLFADEGEMRLIKDNVKGYWQSANNTRSMVVRLRLYRLSDIDRERNTIYDETVNLNKMMADRSPSGACLQDLFPWINAAEFSRLYDHHDDKSLMWPDFWCMKYEDVWPAAMHTAAHKKKFEAKRRLFFQHHVKAIFPMANARWIVHMKSEYGEHEWLSTGLLQMSGALAPEFLNADYAKTLMEKLRAKHPSYQYPWRDGDEAWRLIREHCLNGENMTVTMLKKKIEKKDEESGVHDTRAKRESLVTVEEIDDYDYLSDDDADADDDDDDERAKPPVSKRRKVARRAK